jgi:hypothetical protein
VNSYLLIASEDAKTYRAIMDAVTRRYYNEHPTRLTTLVFEDDDHRRLQEPSLDLPEKSLLGAVCRAAYNQFDIRTVSARSGYERMQASALAHINRTRVTVQGALVPAAVGWSDDDVFVEARRLGWKG